MLAPSGAQRLEGHYIRLSLANHGGIARIKSASRDKLVVESYNDSTFELETFEFVRPRGELKLLEKGAGQAYERTGELATKLASLPLLRRGATLKWALPLIFKFKAISFSEYRPYTHYPDNLDIEVGFERPFRLPGVPAVRIPLIYTHKPIIVTIDYMSGLPISVWHRSDQARKS